MENNIAQSLEHGVLKELQVVSGGEKERAGVAEEESGEIGRARQRRPVCHGADLSGEPLKDLKGRRKRVNFA